MTTDLLKKRMPKPRIGLLPTGHSYYWKQFPELKNKGFKMHKKLIDKLRKLGDVFSAELVDTPEKSIEANKYFQKENIDILLIFPFGYTPGMQIVPCVKDTNVPIRILNAHEDAAYNYKKADTCEYLHHEGVCCVPEYSSALVSLNKKFHVRTGHFEDVNYWKEIYEDCIGAAAAAKFKNMNFAVIGETYTNMTDMPFDEHRLLRVTGKLLKRPEVEEIEEASKRVRDEQLNGMYDKFREMYDVDSTVTNEHMKYSAQLAVAYEEIIKKYFIDAFGYYWWGEKENITTLRSQSALAVSYLGSIGHPGVTEGDIKTAMAMKILDVMGSGGMFLEFFSMDFKENFILMGHDGPCNINVAKGKPKLQHLKIHHGKSGQGLGIDFKMAEGPVTLLNLTQFGAGETFKLIYTIGKVISGDILHIGNPNCRVRVEKPINVFMEEWCQAGPCHHIALGIGNQSKKIESFAETLGFQCVRI